MGLAAETPSDCLARAAYARARADRSRSPADKDSWLRIAREWEQLAATFDAVETVPTIGRRRAGKPKKAVTRIAKGAERK